MKKYLIISMLFIGVFSFYLVFPEEEKIRLVTPDNNDTLICKKVEMDSVFYEADSILYNTVLDRIILMNNARLNYHSSSIEAPQITLDLSTRQANTRGMTILRDKTQLVIGSDIQFDIETLKGRMRSSSGRFEQGFYYGDEIRKVDDEIYDIDRGYFTTCENKEPCFYIYSPRMRLYQDNRVVARPVVFYVNHFPILAMPYMTFSIKRERASGFLVPEPGYNNVDGKYIENIAFYHFFGDHADMLLALDYRELTGWEGRYDFYYLKRYHYQGSLRTRLQRRIISPIHTNTEWQIRARHSQEFLDRSTFNANLEFISSRNIWEGSDVIDERLSQRVTSTVSYRRPMGSSSFNANATYREDLVENHKDITLPNLTYMIPSKPFYELFPNHQRLRNDDFWWKNFSYSYNFRAVHVGRITDPSPSLSDILYKNKQDEHGNYINQHNLGVRHSGSVNYNRTMRGLFSLHQSFRLNEVWYDRDRRNNSPARAMDYSSSTRLSSSVFGIGSYPNFFIRAVRHIMTPSVTYNYTPDFSHNRDKYFSFGGISVNTGNRRQTMSFNLENKWSFKYFKSNIGREVSVNDLFTTSSSLSYDFERDGRGFTDINHSAHFRPGSLDLAFLNFGYNTNISLTQDFYDLNIKNWRLSNRLSFSGSASYVNYFPKEKNDFIANRYYIPDLTEEEVDERSSLFEDFITEERFTEGQDTWRLSVDHDYSRDRVTGGYSSNLRSNSSFKVTNNWIVTYRNFYNVRHKQLISQSLTVTRNLEGWNIYFTWTKQADFWSYRIMLYNVKLPDAMRLRTTDRKRS